MLKEGVLMLAIRWVPWRFVDYKYDYCDHVCLEAKHKV